MSYNSITDLRKAWKSALTWCHFDDLVHRLLKNIKSQKSIIESGAMQDQIGNYLSKRTIAEQRLKIEESSERKRMMISVIEKISSVNCEADHETVMKFWRKTPDFCQWFLENENMLNWLNNKSGAVPKMWLNGMPGSGNFLSRSLFFLFHCFIFEQWKADMLGMNRQVSYGFSNC
jgi:hypothetical protein